MNDVEASTIVRDVGCPNMEVRRGYAAGHRSIPDPQLLHLGNCSDCNKDMFPEHAEATGQSEAYKNGHLVWCAKCRGE